MSDMTHLDALEAEAIYCFIPSEKTLQSCCIWH